MHHTLRGPDWSSTAAAQYAHARYRCCRRSLGDRRQAAPQRSHNIGSALGWVGFDDHDVVAPCLHDALSHGGSGQQRIHRDHTTRQHRWLSTVSTAVLSLVLSATACWASVTPTWCARAESRWTPGAPGVREPRRVLPSSATAGSAACGLPVAGGLLAITPLAQAPSCASNPAQSKRLNIRWSVAAPGGICLKPRPGRSGRQNCVPIQQWRYHSQPHKA